MYLLHDNGRHIFTSPQDCTPAQRFVYVLAKDHHTDDTNSGPSDPSGLKQSNRVNNL